MGNYSIFLKELEEYSTDGGNTWYQTGNIRKGDVYMTGLTSCNDFETTSDELAFEFTGDSATFVINNIIYTATTSPYSTSLSQLGVNTWTNAYGMFLGCTNLTSIISLPSTRNVTDMYGMFARCSGLTSLDLSNFNTSNVTNMFGMFVSCSGLTSLDLSSFNTSNVFYMGEMFYKCSGLISLDLSNWNTNNVTDRRSMFNYCTSLRTITMKNCNASTVQFIRDRLTDAGIANQVTIIQ